MTSRWVAIVWFETAPTGAELADAVAALPLNEARLGVRLRDLSVHGGLQRSRSLQLLLDGLRERGADAWWFLAQDSAQQNGLSWTIDDLNDYRVLRIWSLEELGPTVVEQFATKGRMVGALITDDAHAIVDRVGPDGRLPPSPDGFPAIAAYAAPTMWFGSTHPQRPAVSRRFADRCTDLGGGLIRLDLFSTGDSETMVREAQHQFSKHVLGTEGRY